MNRKPLTPDELRLLAYDSLAMVAFSREQVFALADHIDKLQAAAEGRSGVTLAICGTSAIHVSAGEDEE
jgi:hypothetical protein